MYVCPQCAIRVNCKKRRGCRRAPLEVLVKSSAVDESPTTAVLWHAPGQPSFPKDGENWMLLIHPDSSKIFCFSCLEIASPPKRIFVLVYSAASFRFCLPRIWTCIPGMRQKKNVLVVRAIEVSHTACKDELENIEKK